jgi:hypothetical protein
VVVVAAAVVGAAIAVVVITVAPQNIILAVQLRARIAQSAGVRFQAVIKNYSVFHRVQTSSGAHPAPYTMGTGVSFPGGKAAEV